MKNIVHFRRIVFHATIIASALFIATSCRNNPKLPDSKYIAEEHNEAKFDNTDEGKDAEFLVDAAEIDLAEIELGQLAQQNGTITDVKDLGKMMAVAHSRFLSDLTELAKKKSITIPTSPTDNIKDAYKNLINKSGISFDKEYCDMMVSGHKDAVAIFEKASNESSDADIKAWATATLPSLRSHLDHAITCQKKCEKM